VTLTPGSAVTHNGGKGRTQGFLTILSGVAVFSSADGEESVQPGDMLGWNAAQSYRIENTGHSPLALVLVFEHGAPLPTVTEPVPDYYANLQQAANRVV